MPSPSKNNSGFAPAMSFGSVHRKFPTGHASSPACTGKKASLSQGCRSVFGKPADRSASARQSDDY